MIHGLLSAAAIAVAAAVAHNQNPAALDLVARLRAAAATSPRNPSAWYELGQAYNAVKQNALATFTSPSDAPWRALLSADALLENGHLTDAFTLYRAAEGSLASMVTIHDSVAQIYERTGHTHWAATERARIHLDAADCSVRRALCEFRAGRYDTSLDAATRASDPEARYWTARASNELALAAFKHLDTLPDSVERRLVRAAVAKAQERYTDAVEELKVAVGLSPRQIALQYELASAYYSARDYEQTLATLSPLLERYPEDARLLTLKVQALLELQRADEALPTLQELDRRRPPGDTRLKLALARAYLQVGHHTAAIPLLEDLVADDTDGSLHLQLARAYSAIGQRDKAAPMLMRSEELRKADEERRAATAKNVITPPR
jgi:tetratricopeptide (TPR) repeat protein